MPRPAQTSPLRAAEERYRLAPVTYSTLPGFEDDDHAAAFAAFRCSAEALAGGCPPLRAACSPSVALRRLCDTVLAAPLPLSAAEARRFFETSFTPFRIEPNEAEEAIGRGFLTGYYEPVVAGSPTRTDEFSAPVLRRPSHFERLGPGVAPHPYPPRAMIEAEAERGGYEALVWLRDWVDVFFIQVQGSGRVILPGGRVIRLIYDGRNGQPYTSIGRILVEAGEIAPGDMSLDRLKTWLRAHGQEAGARGRAIMRRNRSYVFFRAEADPPAGAGPIGGAGIPLTPLRSIAIDRTVWCYGLPFWIEADLPWRDASVSPFRRLMVAQDTGSAILGPARADLFFGAGEAAGERAGDIRHVARFVVLLPRGDQPVTGGTW